MAPMLHDKYGADPVLSPAGGPQPLGDRLIAGQPHRQAEELFSWDRAEGIAYASGLQPHYFVICVAEICSVALSIPGAARSVCKAICSRFR